MEEIEKATGRQIVRIETNDLDEMEEVRPKFPPDPLLSTLLSGFAFVTVIDSRSHLHMRQSSSHL